MKLDFLVYLIFVRYKARAGENEEVSEVDHIGRPKTLSPEAMEILKNEVDEQTKTLTAFTIENFEDRINELAKSNNKRKFRHKVCKRTCEINPFQNIAIFQDGAAGQIKSIENTLIDYCQEHNLDVTFCKYAAGTSLSESPNNKGVMHASLHRYFKTSDFRLNEIAEYDIYDWLIVKDILQTYLDPASFKTVWKCLKHSPSFISRAFNRHAIYGGLRDTGSCSSCFSVSFIQTQQLPPS